MSNLPTQLLAGPFGTLLIEDALRYGEVLSPADAMALLLSSPEKGAGIAARYADAGADIVYAPTLCADRMSPSLHSLREVEEYNTSSLKLTKQKVGDIPVSSMLTFIPAGERRKRVEALTEQARILNDAGVEMHTVETLTDADSAQSAVEAVLEAGVRSGVELPVHISFAPVGERLALPEVERMLQYNPSSIGVNCFYPPSEGGRLFEELRRRLPDTPLSIRAAASFPGKPATSPEEMSEIFEKIVAVPGAPRYIGVCCGGNPHHIKHLKNLITKYIP